MDEKQLKTLAERRHPDYAAMLPHWVFLEACYKGGREWFEDNIFRYIKEGDTEFNQRLERAYRFNHSREIVDLVNKYIFKGEIQRNVDDASDPVRRFWQRSTKNGQNIEEYMQVVSRGGSTYGRVYVVVDNNSREPVTTVAEEKKTGMSTYSYIVPPTQALDMGFDADGHLEWIIMQEVGRDDADPFLSSGDAIVRYRLWTKTDWMLFKEEGSGENKKIVLEDGATHGLGVVPVIIHDHIQTDDLYSSPSLIGDIAYLDRAVANYLSNLDAIIQDQTFSQLAMPAQNVIPGEDSYDKMVEMGTKRIFLYNGESGSAPFYLSPDPKQAELIITAIRQIINEIYHTVGMAGERTKQDNSMGIDNSSGVAKAYDFERVNALLAAKAASLDRTEEKMVRLVNLWNGIVEDEEKEYVKYPNNFDVRGLYDEFEIAEKLSLIQAPDAVRRTQMEIVIDKLFPRIEESVKKEMLNELKEWPPQVDVLENTQGTVMSGAKGKPAESPTGDNAQDGQDTGQR